MSFATFSVKYKLTPPHNHQRNAAERAHIQKPLHQWLMLGGHKFPLHLWCRLLDQAELTLNMLHTSRINPNLSAHEQLHSIHDFNATPVAPPGTKCITHDRSSQRGTGAPHGQHGWYMGEHPNTIDVIKSTFQKHRAHEFVIQWNFFQPTAKCPMCHHMMQPYMQQTTSSQHLPSPNQPI